jgi:Acetyltransferase (GNAT) family
LRHVDYDTTRALAFLAVIVTIWSKELRKQIASAEKTGLPAGPDFHPLSTSSKAPTVRLLNIPSSKVLTKTSGASSYVHEYIASLDVRNFSEASECDATAKAEKDGCHSLSSTSLRIRHLPNHVPTGGNASSVALLSPEQLNSCLQLFEGNMGALYRKSSWGLDMDKKRDELVHRKARFILVTTTTKNGFVGNDHNSSSLGNTDLMSSTNPVSGANTGSNASPDFLDVGEDAEKMVAFVHYRYEMDNDELPECLVLYLYEIQVAEEFRGYGLGTVLMNLVEQMATQQPNVEKMCSPR